MTKRSVGFIKLEWTCPNCNTRNPGPEKTCQNCGAPQPENVNFEVGASQELVTDSDEIKRAQAGADFHCSYCGARNPAGTKTCSQCGGDLREGKQRQAGRLLAIPESGSRVPITCTNCGTVNPGTNVNCTKCGSPLPRADAPLRRLPAHQPAGNRPSSQSRVTPAGRGNPRRLWIVAGILGFLAISCIGIYTLFLRPSDSIKGVVDSVYWQTAVQIQEQQEVRYTDRGGNPPPDAYDASCHTDSRDVCEQKTVDLGNGLAEVVEECHTETEQYCSYTIQEWKTVQSETLEGNDLNPFYATPSITNTQRIGDKTATFTVGFSTDKDTYTYTPNDQTEFQRYQIGSEWLLSLNAMGGVLSLEPAP